MTVMASDHTVDAFDKLMAANAAVANCPYMGESELADTAAARRECQRLEEERRLATAAFVGAFQADLERTRS